jgi:choline dehydrogenase-like flavoprotein
MIHIAIVGSGPSAISAAKILLKKRIKVTIFDVGEDLPADVKKKVEIISRKSKNHWSNSDINYLSNNYSLKKNNIPKKMIFGSDYFYAAYRDHSKIVSSGVEAKPTFAKGGYSVAWGAALLPTATCDMKDWPFGRARLSKYYKKVLSTLPLTGEIDELEKSFPSYKKKLNNLSIAPQFSAMRSRLNSTNSSNNKIICGFSRLAVFTNAQKNACKYCGLCLSGCPYGSIYNFREEVDSLLKDKNFKYISNALVTSYKEGKNKVSLLYFDILKKQDIQKIFSKVFLAAGPINSSKIVLRSNNIYNKPIKFIDSQKFVFPIFSFRQFKIDVRNSNTLCSLFLELKFSRLSDHWNHIQISGLNDWVLKKLNLSTFNAFKQLIFSPFLNRVSIGWGGLHSNISSKFTLKLLDNNVIFLEKLHNKDSKIFIIKLLFVMFLKAFNKGIFFIPVFFMSKVGGGCHFGGSFPMRKRPKEIFESDILGRPFGHKNVHLIDATTFPSIPSTTMALLTMANAARIADESC